MIPHTTAEPWEIAALLNAANDIPQDELPDADARVALLAAIRAGQVIGVYRPFGASWHNIELAAPRDVDPRISCAEWMARYRQSQHRQACQTGEQCGKLRVNRGQTGGAQLSQGAQGGQG